MTIILFLVDTSASMNQRTYMGLSLLDVAKGAIDTFLKYRQRDPSRSQDRYMLLSFEDPPNNVKAGWKENQATFAQELKMLRGVGLTNFGPALANAFHLLNVNRLQSGIDTYGSGRCPFYIEQTLVVVLTDGNCLINSSGLQKEVELLMTPFPGSELTKEPFRWDQRVFSLILRIPGSAPLLATPSDQRVPVDLSPVNVMCEVTGGRSYCITNHRILNVCLESLVQKVQSGVVVRWEQSGPDPTVWGMAETDLEMNSVETVDIPSKIRLAKGILAPSSPIASAARDRGDWRVVTKMIFVPKSTMKGVALGHWPIPEAFWPDQTSSSLVPRSAQPLIKFKCEDVDPLLIESFPFDKYELEPSALTQVILQRKQPNSCWQLFVPGSSAAKPGDLGSPFGYLKASSALNCVNMYVMPYNYPVLIPLIDDLMRTMKGRITLQWRADFERYFKSIPIYYLPFLKRAMTRINAANALPDNIEQISLSYSVLSYLKRVKHQAKMEYDRLCQSVTQTKPELTPSVRLIARVDKRNSSGGGSMASKFLGEVSDRIDFAGFSVPLESSRLTSSSSAQFRNPFDVVRPRLLDQLLKMRKNLSHLIKESSIPVLEGGVPGTKLKIQHAEELHSLPVAQMGNYQDYLRLLQPALREVEAAPVRQHAFGNPFKVDKRMLVDEADIDNLMISTERSAVGVITSVKTGKKPTTSPADSPASRGFLKRKRGPLPKHLRFKRWRRSSESVSIGSASPFPESPRPSSDEDFLNDFDVVGPLESVPLPVASQPQADVTSPVVPPVVQLTADVQRRLRRIVRTPGKTDSNQFQISAFAGGTTSLLTDFCVAELQRFKRDRLVEAVQSKETQQRGM